MDAGSSGDAMDADGTAIRPCCANRGDSEFVASPFSGVVATGYYDGATHGFLRCGTCSTTYEFALLDWDDGQDMRVFAVTERGAILEKPRGVTLVIAAEDLMKTLRVWRHWQRAQAPSQATGWLESLGLSRARIAFP